MVLCASPERDAARNFFFETNRPQTCSPSGVGKKSLPSIVNSQSNHGRCFHGVDKTLVLAAAVVLTLAMMDSTILSDSMMYLASSSPF